MKTSLISQIICFTVILLIPKSVLGQDIKAIFGQTIPCKLLVYCEASSKDVNWMDYAEDYYTFSEDGSLIGINGDDLSELYKIERDSNGLVSYLEDLNDGKINYHFYYKDGRLQLINGTAHNFLSDKYYGFVIYYEYDKTGNLTKKIKTTSLSNYENKDITTYKVVDKKDDGSWYIRKRKYDGETIFECNKVFK